MQKQSKTELKLLDEMRRIGLKPVPQYEFSNKYGIMHVDFAFLKEKVVVEVDGPDHNKEDVRKRDYERDSRLQSIGWKIKRISADEAWNETEKAAKKVKHFLEASGTPEPKTKPEKKLKPVAKHDNPKMPNSEKAVLAILGLIVVAFVYVYLISPIMLNPDNTAEKDNRTDNGPALTQQKPVAPSCGDSSCNGEENCLTCAKDCACQSGYLCVEGTCEEKETCGNGRCGPMENSDNCCNDCGCDDGYDCEGGNCKLIPICGNNWCQESENKANCCRDCGCDEGYECSGNQCTEIPSVCGDGVCEKEENKTNCCDDCGCDDAKKCINNECMDIRLDFDEYVEEENDLFTVDFLNVMCLGFGTGDQNWDYSCKLTCDYSCWSYGEDMTSTHKQGGGIGLVDRCYCYCETTKPADQGYTLLPSVDERKLVCYANDVDYTE